MKNESTWDGSATHVNKDKIYGESDYPEPPKDATFEPWRLGDYMVVGELGRGGMGIVYEAIDVSLDRRVALKVLPNSLALNSKQCDRFRVEAQAAAKLSHPGIVPVYHIDDDNGTHFFSMRLIEGENLATMLEGIVCRVAARNTGSGDTPPMISDSTAPAGGQRRGRNTSSESENRSVNISDFSASEYPLPRSPGRRYRQGTKYVHSVARIGIQAARALDHAHEAEILHRDVKPSNLMLDDNGHLWVADFGLARVRDSIELTESGDLIGTLRYMSPEQVSGRRRFVDHRTDIYSLGITLYELLTLKRAVVGPTPQDILRQISFNVPVPVRKQNPQIPEELEIIVHKAIERNPADRYATAAELADDLERYLAGDPLKATRPSFVKRCKCWVHRHQTAAATIFTAVTVLLITSLLSSAAIFRSLQAETQQRKKTEKQLRISEGSRLIASAATNLHNDPGLAIALAIEGATRNPSVEADAVLLQSLDSLHELTTFFDVHAPVNLAVSPDARHVVSTTFPGGDASIHNLKTRKTAGALKLDSQKISSAAFSRDGRYLLTSLVVTENTPGGRAVIWDATTLKLHGAFDDSAVTYAASNAFSPSCDRVILPGRKSGARIFDIARLDPLVSFAEKQIVTACCFSPDDKYVATISEEGRLCVWDSLNGNLIIEHKSTPSPRAPRAFHFTADSDEVVISRFVDEPADNRGTWFFPIGEQGQVFYFLSGLFAMNSVSSSPVFAVSNSKFVRIFNSETKKVSRTLTLPGRVRFLTLSPNGDYVLVICQARTHDVPRIYSTKSGDEIATLKGHSDRVFTATFVADSQSVVTGGSDRTVRHWDIKSSRQRSQFSSNPKKFAFSSDGEQLAISTRVNFCELYDGSGKRLGQRVMGKISNQNTLTLKYLATFTERTAYIRDTLTLEEIASRTIPDQIVRIRVIPGQQKALVRDIESGVWLWDFAENDVIALNNKGERVHAKISPSGNYIGVCSGDGEFRVIEAATGRLRIRAANSASLRKAAFSQNDQHVATIDVNSTVRLWQLPREGFQDGAEPIWVRQENDAPLFDAEFVNDDKWLLTFGQYGVSAAIIHEVATGDSVAREPTVNLDRMQVFPSTQHVLVMFEGAPPKIWDLQAGTMREFETPNIGPAALLGNTVVTVTSRQPAKLQADVIAGSMRFWNKDGKLTSETPLRFQPFSVAADSEKDRILVSMAEYPIEVYDFESGERKQRIFGVASAIRELHFCESQLIAACSDARIRTYDSEQKRWTSHDGHTSRITASTVSFDEKLLLTGDEQGNVFAWDTGSWSNPRRVTKHNSPVLAIHVDHQSAVASLESDKGRIHISDLRIHDKVKTLEPTDGCKGISLSSNGQHLLVLHADQRRYHNTTPPGVSLLNTSTWELNPIEVSDPRAMQFSADGRRFAILMNSGELKIYVTDSRLAERAIKITPEKISAFCFGPNAASDSVLTWQSNGLSRWNLKTGKESFRVSFLRAASTYFMHAEWKPWNPNGRSFVTRSRGIQSWPAAPIIEAKKRAPRNLSAEELRRFEIPVSQRP